MPRVKRGIMTRKRHNRVLKDAKGYWGARSAWFRLAKDAVAHSGQYAYRDRRTRKREFRRLWIARINAACRAEGMTYSRFVNGLIKAQISIDRKVLSELAISDPAAFRTLVQQASAALAG